MKLRLKTFQTKDLVKTVIDLRISLVETKNVRSAFSVLNVRQKSHQTFFALQLLQLHLTLKGKFSVGGKLKKNAFLYFYTCRYPLNSRFAASSGLRKPATGLDGYGNMATASPELGRKTVPSRKPTPQFCLILSISIIRLVKLN